MPDPMCGQILCKSKVWSAVRTEFWRIRADKNAQILGFWDQASDVNFPGPGRRRTLDYNHDPQPRHNAVVKIPKIQTYPAPSLRLWVGCERAFWSNWPGMFHFLLLIPNELSVVLQNTTVIWAFQDYQWLRNFFLLTISRSRLFTSPHDAHEVLTSSIAPSRPRKGKRNRRNV